MPEHLNVVGPKLSLNVVGADLSLSQNFARHSKFRVCQEAAQPLRVLDGGFKDRGRHRGSTSDLGSLKVKESAPRTFSPNASR